LHGEEICTSAHLHGSKSLDVSHFSAIEENFHFLRGKALGSLEFTFHVKDSLIHFHLEGHGRSRHHLDGDLLSLLCFQTDFTDTSLELERLKILIVMLLLVIKEQFNNVLFDLGLVADHLLDVCHHIS